VKLILYANGLLLWVVGCFCCIHLYAEGVIQTSITLPVTKISPPPPPYEDFCRREPEACLLDGPATIGFTPTNVELMTKIGAQVNSEISFSMDTDQYFQEDFWSLPHSGKGDCEDIALEKRQRLAMLGFPRAALRIAIVFHKGYLCPHALLTIETDRGTYVLDSFFDEIYTWNQLPYNFASRERVDGQWEYFDQNAWTFEPITGIPPISTP